MHNKIVIAVAVVTIVVGIAVWKSGYFGHVPTNAPTYKIEMVDSEQVNSWNFKGAYTTPELQAKANAEIKRLKSLFGTEKFSDYILYISIANQYDLLGDGGNELLYLEKALALDSTETGLAWQNAGQLFARLGAYKTARMAFERSVAAQPIQQYQQALDDFIKSRQ